MDFDSLEDQQQPQAVPSFDEMQSELPSFDDMEAEKEVTSSGWAAPLRRAAMEAAPGLAGGLAGLAAFPVAAVPGAAAGPIGAATTGIIGAIGAGTIAHAGVKALQDKILEGLGLSEGEGNLSKVQELADRELHPYGTFGGELGANLTAFSPGRGAALAARGIGAGFQGGMEALTSWLNGDGPDPIKVAMAAGAGAAMPFTNALAQKGINRVLPKRYQEGFGKPGEPEPPPEKPPGGPGEEVHPDDTEFGAPQQERIGRGPLDGEIIPPEKGRAGQSAYEADRAFAEQQRDSFPDGDPMREFWQSHMDRLDERWANSEVHGDPNKQFDASLGPNSEDNPFTYQQSNRANDITTVSPGIAAENPPAPQVKEAGNPYGAPMLARQGARPTDPRRDYRKQKALPAPEGQTPSTRMSTAAIHEDVAAALNHSDMAKAMPDEALNQVFDATNTGHQTGQNPTALPERVFPPEELSRMQREAEGNVQQRMSEQQLGEEPGPGTLNPDRPAAPQQKEPVIPSTPAERAAAKAAQKTTDALVKRLKAAGMETLAEKVPSLTPEQRAYVESHLEPAEKAAYDKANRPKVGEVQARSHEDAARKKKIVDAWEEATAKYAASDADAHIPTAKKEVEALVERLEKMLAHANELVGEDAVKAYRPNVKPASRQVLAAAARVVAKPTPKNVKEYFTRVKALTVRDVTAAVTEPPAGASLAKETQATNRIDADISRRVKPELAEANLAQPDTSGRVEFEPFENHNQDYSAVETRDQNSLRTWLNTLSDEQYARLKEANPDIETDVKNTQDPAELMRNYLDDLSEASREKLRTVPAARKTTEVRTAAEVERLSPTKPGAPATTGKVLDKNSPEFKRLAAEALAAAQKKQPRTKTEQMAALEERIAGEADQQSGRADVNRLKREAEHVTQEPVDGRAGWDTLKDFLSDESGSVPIDLFKKVWGSVHDFFDPQASTPVMDYGKALGGLFTKLKNRITNFRAELKANVFSAPKMTHAEYGQMYRAEERGERGLLNGKLKDYMDTHYEPLAQKYGVMYDEFKTLMNQLKLPGWDKLPDRVNLGNGFMNFVPRLNKDGFRKFAEYDPLAPNEQSLHSWASTAQARDYFTLQDGQGNRFTYVPSDGGYITRMTNGRGSRIYTKHSNSFDPTQVGSTIELTRNGKKDTWTVDHSTIDEIKLAAGKDAAGNWKEEHMDNPVATMTNALYGLSDALERVRAYRDIVNAQVFKDNITRNGNDPRIEAFGWIKPKLQQFDDTWMPKQFAWALDDFRLPGFGSTNRAKRAVDYTAGLGTRLFYFFGPAVHMLNEADKWVIGRGYDWVTPQGWKSLVVNGQKALKAVYTQDLNLYREIAEAGGNPMLMHTLTQDLLPRMGQRMGEDIGRNPSRWDPVARAFGMTTPELGKAAYRASTGSMWWVTDVLAIQRYLEGKQLRGMSNEQAVKYMHDFMDSYVMPTTIGGKGDLGRGFKQFLSDPSVALFGPYHYGIFHSWANMAKNLVQKNKTPQERAMAASQFMVAGAMLYFAYPMLSAGYQALTGSKHSEVDTRGMSKLPDTAHKFMKGEKTAADALRNVWTPSVPVDTVTRQFQNKDFAGKDILPPMDMHKVQSWKTLMGREADFILGQMMSPVKTAINAYNEPGKGGASNAAKKFLESNVGVKTPTDKGIKRQYQLPTILERERRMRDRQGGGLFERILR